MVNGREVVSFGVSGMAVVPRQNQIGSQIKQIAEHEIRSCLALRSSLLASILPRCSCPSPEPDPAPDRARWRMP